MANWCYNKITFEGSSNVIEQLKKLFEALAEKEVKEEHGQLPDFVQNGERFMFCINWEYDTLSYETRWSPNVEEMKQVADFFKTNFTYYYEELGNLVYGVVRYENGVLTDTFLDSADFDLFEENEGSDTWTLEENIYESEYDILELLLERKENK
jgi:hypothetical protein